MMSSWNQFFDELDRIYHQGAQLLKDGEALLGDHGFVCSLPFPNQVGMESSYSIQNPRQWFLRWVVRLYGREEPESSPPGKAALFLAIFFSDEVGRGDWAWSPRVEEPLVVAGVIEGHPGKEIKWEHWMCKYWFWSEDAEIGGKISQIEPDLPRKNNWKVMYAFAIPLSSIENIEKLKERVTDPLLKLLDENPKESARTARQSKGR